MSRFEERRGRLADMFGSGSLSGIRSGTLVVVPSMTFPEEDIRRIIGFQFYEERLLFLLLLLRHRALNLAFVTSVRVDEAIVGYYLRFVPPEVRPRDRLELLALNDAEPRALTAKILESADAVAWLRELALEGSCLVVFTVSPLEARLAEEIDVAFYGCPLELVHLGSKSGSRRVGRAAGVAILPGAEDLYSLQDIEQALDVVRAAEPGCRWAVVKLNEGLSGHGNAVVELTSDLPLERRPAAFCAEEESWQSFARKLEEQGGIVEHFLKIPGLCSPSVQMCIAPDGSYQVVSTHEQILAGPDHLSYAGCRFPADDRYRKAIQHAGRRVARVLAAEGVVGLFGVDFVVAPEETATPYLIEINLRMGGTTHPFLMTQLVTGGTFDEETGNLMVDGRSKYYVARDSLWSDAYVGLRPETVISAIDDSGLAFDRATNTGVLLHLLGALEQHGKVGMTCVADSRADADELYRLATAVLDEISRP